MRLWTLLALWLVWGCVGPAVAAEPIPPQDPHAHLRQVMEDPLFHRWQRRVDRPAGDGDSAWTQRIKVTAERIGNWVEALWEWLFPDRSTPVSSSGPWMADGWDGIGRLLAIGGWTLAGLAVLMIVVIVVKLIREAKASPGRARLTREQIRQALDSGEALAADSDEWADEAQRLAEEQDLRRAYRAMYLALLSGLHRARRIDFRRTRTNWIYVQHYRGPDPDRQSFAELTQRFDDIWYGQRPPQRDSFGSVRAQVNALLGKGAAHA